MSGRTHHTSRCQTVGCAWRSEDENPEKLTGLESMHSAVTGHRVFVRDTALRLEDDVVVGGDLVGSRRVVQLTQFPGRQLPPDKSDPVWDAYGEVVNALAKLRDAIINKETPS